VSWAKWSPRVRQSAGKRKGSNATGRGNPYLGAALGEAGISAGNTQSFLGARYRKLTRRMPKKKALVATGNSVLTIIHALLSDPAAVYTDLGADYYEQRMHARRQARKPRQEPGTPRLQSHHRSHRPGNRRAHRSQLTTTRRTRRR
jgi:transposase